MRQVRFRTDDGFVRVGDLVKDDLLVADREYRTDEVEFLVPCKPTKIVCVGLNYEGHIQETGKDRPDRPSLFLKGPNTLSSHGSTITLSDSDKRFDYEAEIGVVIGRQCRSVNRKQSMDYVAGFTAVNDLSNRDDQIVEENWVRGKSFDCAAPIGPAIASPEEVPEDASIEARVNGEVRQSSSRDQLIFSVEELIAEISRYLTLEEGDIIATGTPRGIASLNHGDTIEIEIEGVGTLRNTIQFSGSS